MLPLDFFARPTLEVAPDLLGKLLVTTFRGTVTAGRIVEVEAYLGERDLASHASKGRTARNAPMFGPPGHAYVYLIYGMHHCFNVVTESHGVAGAVLIRAVEPVHGLTTMRRRRGIADDRALTSGPGKLCEALAIDRRQDGVALAGPRLFIAGAVPEMPASENGAHPLRIRRSPRIGVDYAGDWAARPYRFFLEGHPCVSRG